MKCVICKQGETRPGRVSLTLERPGLTLVFKGVPAEVCENCGEEYIEQAITSRLLSLAEEADRAGVEVDVREYVPT